MHVRCLRWQYSGLLLALLFWMPCGAGAQTPAIVYPGADWEVSTPEAEGMDPVKFATAMANLPAKVVVIRHGKIIGQKGDITLPGPLYSASKGLLVTLAGVLMHRGAFTLDTLVPGSDQNSPPRAAVRHFLSMTSDFRIEPHNPGYHYAYSNSGATYFGNWMFGTWFPGRYEVDALKDAYLDTLGFQDPVSLTGSVSGWGGGGFVVSTRDFARVGYLYLRGGNWQGRQLLPPEYVASIYASQVPLNLTEGGLGIGQVDNQTPLVSPRLPGTYSFGWWLPNGTHGYGGTRSNTLAATASGSHGTSMHIVPKYDLVICGVNTIGSVETGGKVTAAMLDMVAAAVVQVDLPTPPAPVKAVVNGANVVVSWGASSGAAGYQVFRGASQIADLPASSLSYTDLNMPEGTYLYSVQAVDSNGKPSARIAASYLVVDRTPPAPPSTVTASVSGSTATVGWNAAADNVAVFAYRVYRDGARIGQTDGAVLTFTDSSVPSGMHTWAVDAVDFAGNASAVSGDSVADPTPPAAPGSVIAAVSGADIVVTWTASTDNIGVVRYNIFRGATAAGSVAASALTFTDAAVPDGTYVYSVEAVDAAGNRSARGTAPAVTKTTAPPPPGGLRFIPVTPCRAADTRNPAGPFGGPAISGGSARAFVLPNSGCGIPANAQAYALNVTAIPHGPLGFLTVWPSGKPQPVVSTLNSFDGRVKANAAILSAGANGAISVFVTDTADVVLDVNGYFVPETDPGGLAFYPVAPCRAFDTRLVGSALSAGETRAAPISGLCGIPAAAQAYSVNITAVPHSTLGFLTVWPAGAPQPFVSTLNSFTGAITANAAIVAAGSGGTISLFVTDAADLIVDVNGYFAPPAGGGFSFYPAGPCRAVDTRLADAPALAGGEPRSFAIPASSCALPAAAAYSLNATVIPQGQLGFLSLWPSGISMPVVSTLNAIDGAITSNAAIVPASANGSVAAYAAAAGASELILDISGYFGP